MDKFLTTDLTKKSGADYFKIKEGANKVRILSSPVYCYQKYVDGKYLYSFDWTEGYSKRFNSYIIDGTDNKLKWFAMPKTIATAIQGFSKDEDYAFTKFPMPFDITITATNAGTMEVEYLVLPKPKSEVSKEILEELSKKERCQVVLENKVMKLDSKDEEALNELPDVHITIPSNGEVSEDEIGF